jgi:hypothetical protein
VSRFVPLSPGSEGPMCPRGLSTPIAPEHELRTRMLDAYYTATPTDPDTLEQPEPAATAYHAAAYGDRTTDHMRLYEHTATIGIGLTRAVAYWWRCSICGLILPATEVRS